MPEPERDAQLPREAVPVTVTATNRAPGGPEYPEAASGAQTGAQGVPGVCGNCGDPLEPCPCGDPCGKTYCFGCDDIEQLHVDTPSPACLRPDTCTPGDPGGWHSISARPSEDAQIWADRAAGATPHQEQQP